MAVQKGVILIGNNTSSSISKLTEESSLNEANLNEVPNKACHEVSLLNTTARDAADAEASHDVPLLNTTAMLATYAPSTEDADDVAPSNRKYGGHPKGSTISNILEQKKNVEEATQAAVEMLAELQSKKSNESSQVEKGSLTEIIFEAKKEYNVPEDVVTLETTVRQRLK